MKLSSLALGLTLLAAAPSVAQRTPEPKRIQAVEHGLRGPVVVAGEISPVMSLTERMAHYKVPGVSIAVIDEGKIVWAKGYGLARAGEAVTTATQFSTGSISKPVTAVAAMRRAQAGALPLDRDVNLLLKQWKVPASPLSADEAVTLRRLLSHGAGLSVHGFYPGYESGKPLPTNIQILNGQAPAVNKPVQLELKPGTKWSYSGGGYQVVQQLLTEEQKTAFPRLMQMLLFTPLKMRASTFEQLAPDRAPLTYATAHDGKGNELPGRWMLLPEMAAAGLWSTPTDLARLAIALQQAWKGKRGGIVSPAVAREMFTRQTGDWGLGFELKGEGQALRFRHYGDNPGYKAVMIAYPATGQGAVILTNGDRGFRLIEEILFSVAAAYGWPDYAPTVKTPVRVQDGAYSRVEGTYDLTNVPNVQLIVKRRGDALLLRLVQPTGESESELLPASPNRFFRRDIDFELDFDAGNPAPKLTLYQDGQVFTATRKQ